MIMETTDAATGEAQWKLVTPADDLTRSQRAHRHRVGAQASSTGFLQGRRPVDAARRLPTQDMFGQAQPPLRTWQQVRQQLGQDYTVQTVDLSTGQVPPEVNVLVVDLPAGAG
jgi:hypothetical protein